MADNVIANAGTGGATFRSLSDGTSEWPASVPAYVTGGTSDAWALTHVSGTTGLPVQGVGGTLGVSQVGAWGMAISSGTLGVVTSVGNVAGGTLGVVSNLATGTLAAVTSVGNLAAGTLGVVSSVTNVAGGTLGSVNNVAGGTLGAVTSVTNLAGGTLGQVTNVAGGQIQSIPGTTGGLSAYCVVGGTGNNLAQIKGGASTLYSVSLQQIGTAPIFVKLFDRGTSGLAMGTTTANYQWMCPANGTAALGAGIVHSFHPGLAFGTGMSVALTYGIALTDNTAIAANVANLLLEYK